MKQFTHEIQQNGKKKGIHLKLKAGKGNLSKIKTELREFCHWNFAFLHFVLIHIHHLQIHFHVKKKNSRQSAVLLYK